MSLNVLLSASYTLLSHGISLEERNGVLYRKSENKRRRGLLILVNNNSTLLCNMEFFAFNVQLQGIEAIQYFAVLKSSIFPFIQPFVNL